MDSALDQCTEKAKSQGARLLEEVVKVSSETINSIGGNSRRAVEKIILPEQVLLQHLRLRKDIQVIEERHRNGAAISVSQLELLSKKGIVDQEIVRIENLIKQANEGNLSKEYQNICFSVLDMCFVRDCIDDCCRRGCSLDDVAFELSSD